MYLEFYGLTESPFNLTPDTNFLFPSRVHREVLAHLLYGVNSRKGFIMVTGEVGSGKTTLCRALLSKLGPNTEVALVLNSFLSELELLRTINEDLGIQSSRAGSPPATKKELIDDLNDFLLDQRMKGKNVILIIDEAQNLSFPVLEQIRMLSNLETEKEKLLQIVLVGQPELRRLLGSPRLRQLNQRITVRHHVTPLTRKETVQYIYHRLKVAGSSGNLLFTNSALNEIWHFSGGIPRMINVVCDQALLAAYVDNSMRVDHKMIRAAEAEMKGVGKRPTRFLGREFSVVRVGAIVGLVIAAIMIAVTSLRSVIERALFPEQVLSADGVRLSGLARGQAEPGVHESLAGNHDAGLSPPSAVKEETRESRGNTPTGPSKAATESPGPEPKAPEGAQSEPPAPVAGPDRPAAPPSLMRLAFLAGATSRLGGILPDTLASDMEPLFSLRSRTPLRFPPGPKVKLSTKTPVTKTSDRRVIAYRSFVEPMFSLLRLWRRPATAINAVRQRYEEVGGHLPSLAAAAGMGWATLRANLDTLRMIDLPALLQVVGETEERKGYVILLALGDTWVEVATAAGKRRLSLALFSEMYAGNAIVLCDDEFVNPTRLRQGGGINLSVRKLQDYMKAAGHFDGNASGWFTPETAAAVAAFQKEHGLPPSGEADSLTKLLVYASGGLSELPRLRVSE